jgi:ribosomal protein S18 acetylase RimI-like enzyme
MATKEGMLRALPLRQGDVTIRAWIRKDVDLLAGWPTYPFPYEGFEFSFAAMSATERDELFRARQEEPNMTVLVVDHAKQPAIGYIAVMLIDWGNGTRLDVAASNARAIRCYEKVGFVRTGEMWRDASNLNDVDMNEPRYDFIRPHIRKHGGEVKLCFWVMELGSKRNWKRQALSWNPQ